VNPIQDGQQMARFEPGRRLFLREKPVLALLAIGEMETAYAAAIAKRIDSTVPHTSSILSELEAQGLIVSRMEGRIKHLALTERGRRIEEALRALFELLAGPDEQWKRLERLRQLAKSASGPNAALQLGPLRRDLARLQRHGEDEGLQKAALELDAWITAAINR